jgi:putative hydrolase of the HAD superfamily
MPPRALFVDFGRVLYRTPDPEQMAALLRRLGIRDPGPLGVMHLSPRESQIVMDIMTGATPEQQVWAELSRSWRVHPLLIRLLRSTSYNRRRLDRPLIAAIQSLRPRVRTAILTNAGSEFRATFVRAFALDRLVDRVIISAEERLAKPDPAIFYLAAEQMGCRPEDAVFVDDMPENVEGAREAGMTAFVHTHTAETLATLRQLFS